MDGQSVATDDLPQRRRRLRRLLTAWSPIRFVIDAVGIGLCLLAVAVTIDATSRKLLNSPVHGVYELSQLATLAVIAAGIAAAAATDSHIRIELLRDRMPGWFTRVADVFGSILGIAFFGLLTLYSVSRMLEDWANGNVWTGYINIPTYIPWAILVTASLFSAASFARSTVTPADRDGYFIEDA